MTTKQLIEAGRVLSAKNEAKLKAAVAAVHEVLGAMAKVMPASKAKKTPPTAEATEAAEALREAADVLRQSDSADSQRQMLGQSLRDTVKAEAFNPMEPDAYGPYAWIRDVFDDTVVYEQGCCLYSRPYTIDTTGDEAAVIWGAPIEVELAYIPVGEAATTESAHELTEDFVRLVERAVRADGSTDIKIISPGWGSSGYYPAAVLERDGPTVFPAGLKMFANHPTPAEEAQRPERDINDMAAVLTSAAKWQAAGVDGPGLYASARVYEAYRSDINDKAADIGVSIRAFGKARPGEAEGRKGPIIEALVSAKSVDFVTDPGRGGKILSLREAAALRQPIQRPLKEAHMTPEEEARFQSLQESNATLVTQVARLTEGALVGKARDIVVGKLAAVRLPDVTKARLVESLAINPPTKDGAIDATAFDARIAEAVKDEAAYLASVTGSGSVRGMGSAFDESAEDAKPEDLQASLKESFAALGLSESAAADAAKGRA